MFFTGQPWRAPALTDEQFQSVKDATLSNLADYWVYVQPGYAVGAQAATTVAELVAIFDGRIEDDGVLSFEVLPSSRGVEQPFAALLDALAPYAEDGSFVTLAHIIDLTLFVAVGGRVYEDFLDDAAPSGFAVEAAERLGYADPQEDSTPESRALAQRLSRDAVKMALADLNLPHEPAMDVVRRTWSNDA